jgi:hypothetical protein
MSSNEPAKNRPRRMVLAALASSMALAACTNVRAAPSTTGAATSSHAPYSRQGANGSGSSLSGSPGHDQSGVYSGSFSAAFARCMRVNGVPGFPDPDGRADQLAADGGLDTHSAAFQAALYGPCETLAPPGWVAAAPLGPLPAAPS